jgi:hypothetical protein
MLSLTTTGTHCAGSKCSPERDFASMARASAMALGLMVIIALIFGPALSYAAIRSSSD